MINISGGAIEAPPLLFFTLQNALQALSVPDGFSAMSLRCNKSLACNDDQRFQSCYRADWMAPKYSMNWPRIGSSQSVGKSGGSVCPKLTFLGPALAK
ncbi:MAG: hypothetical protein WA206_12270 [Candidatus Binatus sp.]|jgi:hypothetical protein